MSSSARFSEKHSDKWPKRNQKRNGSRAKTRYGVNYVSFCSECPSNSRPINIDPGQRIGSCPQGHKFDLRW